MIKIVCTSVMSVFGQSLKLDENLNLQRRGQGQGQKSCTQHGGAGSNPQGAQYLIGQVQTQVKQAPDKAWSSIFWCKFCTCFFHHTRSRILKNQYIGSNQNIYIKAGPNIACSMHNTALFFILLVYSITCWIEHLWLITSWSLPPCIDIKRV